MAECSLFGLCKLVPVVAYHTAAVNCKSVGFPDKKKVLFLALKIENCTLLRCYAASKGNSLPTFRDTLSVTLKMYC